MAPRPQLNGRLIRLNEDSPPIYLVDEGRKRHVPNPQTFDNLFRDWDRLDNVPDLNEIDDGTAISNGAILARAINTAPVYLIDNGVKRHIASPETMDKYYFSWEEIRGVDQIMLDNIPSGAQIQ
ncbi:MAG: hypothetical protein CLLPBCKN_000444 [Chroococcidiopsis cubana SAG 39.79]|uniref:Uncharacterized protein n=1 Tax=Chroococcidiopsis cubana SAG 39.79 TaxID=388085 RepID=A0AB37UAJ7_9CYAN|nr:hypothetical protein [Chroococcidiopsis cubana]MDZ4871056.1 hypothetical protein [Chroococcidiopsis cubana SAG 39.79]PSB65577.1 hypothetical protein C7B79_04760 [Chroococcidiopsis cubana CCALA 043]RUT02344.1 hypothetical protein DSM107010_62840 [Chroococcidiopsis cubana SAG 39.79]